MKKYSFIFILIGLVSIACSYLPDQLQDSASVEFQQNLAIVNIGGIYSLQAEKYFDLMDIEATGDDIEKKSLTYMNDKGDGYFIMDCQVEYIPTKISSCKISVYSANTITTENSSKLTLEETTSTELDKIKALFTTNDLSNLNFSFNSEKSKERIKFDMTGESDRFSITVSKTSFNEDDK